LQDPGESKTNQAGLQRMISSLRTIGRGKSSGQAAEEVRKALARNENVPYRVPKG